MTGLKPIMTCSSKTKGGTRLAAARVPDGIEGVARLHALVADHADYPADVTVMATETDRGLFVGAMVAAGYRGVGDQPDVGGPVSATVIDVGSEVGSR